MTPISNKFSESIANPPLEYLNDAWATSQCVYFITTQTLVWSKLIGGKQPKRTLVYVCGMDVCSSVWMWYHVIMLQNHRHLKTPPSIEHPNSILESEHQPGFDWIDSFGIGCSCASGGTTVFVKVTPIHRMDSVVCLALPDGRLVIHSYSSVWISAFVIVGNSTKLSDAGAAD